MKQIRLWYACLGLLFPCCAIGQGFPVIHYGIEDGLRSGNIYDVHEDSAGILWLATEQGLASFNGVDFHTQAQDKDGNTIASIIRLFGDAQGRIWMGTHKHGVFVREHGQIRHSGIQVLTSRGLVKLGEQLFVLGNELNVFDAASGDKVTSFPTAYLDLRKSDAHQGILLTEDALYAFDSHADTTVLFRAINGRSFTAGAVSSEGNILLGQGGAVQQWSGQGLITRFSASDSMSITNLMEDHAGRIWFSDDNEGLFIYADGRITNLGAQTGLEDTHVTRVLEDKYGNVWVATIGQGLFRFHHTYVRNYDRKTGYTGGRVFTIVPRPQGGHLVGTYNELYVQLGQDLNVIPIANGHFFRDAISMSEGKVIMAMHPRKGKTMKPTQHQGVTYAPMLAYAIATDPQQTWLYSSYYSDQLTKRHYGPFAEESGTNYFFGERLLGRTNKLLFHQGLIWQAATEGLRIIDTSGHVLRSWMETTRDGSAAPETGPRQNVHSVKVVNNEVWAVTNDHIWQISKAQETFSIRTISWLDITGLTCFEHDKQGRLWVGTLNGLHVFENEQACYHFTRFNALASDEVTSLSFDPQEQAMVVGTASGLSIINLEAWTAVRDAPPALWLRSAESSAGALDSAGQKWSISDRDFLRITLAATNMSEAGALTYRYELDGNEAGFNRENTIMLSSLQDGDHLLRIAVKTENSRWSEPLEVRFHVFKPWYRSRWFLTSMVLFILVGGLFAWGWWQQRQHRIAVRQERVKGEMNRLKLQSLLSLMRPHFVSNVLTAVRQSLHQDDRLQADSAMSKLSHLMRANLQSVQLEYTSIASEAKWLRSYIELERYVRQAHWSYTLRQQEDVNWEEWLIMPMLVQPFVENAILHALASEEDHLTVEWNMEQGRYCISITDSGPGFDEQQAPHKDHKHVSQGIRIVRERLDIVSRLTGQPCDFEISNGRMEGEDFGTRVVLRIPVAAAAKE